MFIMDEIEEEYEIIIESSDQNDDDGNCIYSTSSLIINGEKVPSNGNHIQAILDYLGIPANVYFN